MSGSAAAGGVSEVHSTLQQLAARMSADGHPIQAIKCYLAMLNHSALPTDEAATRLKLAQLLLQHTLNAQDAKQHLQQAELLVMPLHGQHLLKCEVLAALAASHGLLGELEFQHRCYNKGLEQCRDTTASNSDRRCLVKWAVYFHMHLAASMTSKGQAAEAAQQAEAAARLASSHNLLQQQVLCNLFLLQLAVAQYDKPQATTDLVTTLTALLAQLEAQQEPGQQSSDAQVAGDAPMEVDQQQEASADVQSRHLAYMKLHFCMLQLMMKLQFGHFKELYPKKGSEELAMHVPPVVEQMDELLQQLTNSQQQQMQPSAAEGSTAAAAAMRPQFQAPYEWLPLPALVAAVHFLAAVIDKTAGRRKQGHTRISRGLQVLDSHLTVLLQDKASAQDSPMQSQLKQELRVCLSLRMLLLETRQQLYLLCSDFAAARADTVASIYMINQFPKLLAGLSPVVHLQAGLYAQDVGAHAAAVKHFLAAAQEAQQLGLLHLASDSRCLAVLGCLAQHTTDSANMARELLGPVDPEADAGLGYGSRCLQHTVRGLLQLSETNLSSDGREDANQNFSKALKMAHGRLHNHQAVSQLLMLMAPLQVAAANIADAKKLLSSCVQLSHGASDLPTQVKALSSMQQLLESSGVQEEQANNRNYVARKQEELSTKMQEAEADAQQHRTVLTWGL